MKRYYWLFSILILIVMFMLIQQHFWRRFYLKIELDPYVNILSNTNEAFVFIGKTTTGQSGSLIGIFIKSLIVDYPGVFDRNEDLDVIHIKDGRIGKFSLKQFGFSGSAFPYHGTIYFLRGGNQSEWPLLWKWNTTNFIKIDKASATTILNSFGFTDALIKSEGWKETRIRFNGREAVASFQLGLGQYKLSLIEEATDGHIYQTVKVVGNDVATGEEVLVRVDSRSKAVTQREYSEEFKSKQNEK